MVGNGDIHLGVYGGEPFALCGVEDYLRLNGGTFSPEGGFWANLMKERNRKSARLVFTITKEGVKVISPAEEEALHKAGGDSWELPAEVAESLISKAEELGISSSTLMAVVIENRESEGSLCVRDIRRGLQIAERRYTNGRAGK